MQKPFLSILIFLFWGLEISAQSACLGSDTIRIVVIGSSTAAGAGASPSDSSWVNRYRRSIQGLNAANEVINIARGGYNTWRLMPDYFSPPSNRPSPDTLRNISHAIRQNPDAIIINLPSNDAAIGTGINEQMSNFIHMDSLAASHGIPVWVCTTQPRNLNSNAIAVQLGVRDSILSYFGNRALDFWTGLANTQNTIDSTYDSGDGVHVNNAGHRLLWQRALQGQIPDSLISGPQGIDLKPSIPQLINPEPCGRSQTEVEIEVANMGADSLNGSFILELIREDLLSNQTDTLRQSIQAINSCAFIYPRFTLNTSFQTRWLLRARIVYANDIEPSNNESASLRLNTDMQPRAFGRDTVLCSNDSIILSVNGTDEMRWFADASLNNQLYTGYNYRVSGTQSDSLFIRSYRGPFYFNQQLTAATSSNIKWNGTMFNLIAGADTVYVDSIDFYSGNSADLQVNLRTKAGSYIGHESNPLVWSASLSDSIYNAQEDSLYTLNFGTIKINPFDTLGCYLYLENSSHRLSYQWSNALAVFQSAALSLQAGTGVSHTFGSTFHPRHFRGSLHYHHGYNPEGQCQSEIDTIIIRKSLANLYLGPDTSLGDLDSLILRLPRGFGQALWSDGSLGDSLIISHPANLAGRSQWYWLEAVDSLGCLHRDSLQVFFLGLSLVKNATQEFELYPNPSQRGFYLEGNYQGPVKANIFSLKGTLLREVEIHQSPYFWNPGLPQGMYILKLEAKQLEQYLKIMLE